ncbi:MAG TPA: hypothetical protein VKA44_02270, partial [Gemmatimonadota bacterium]|nr:hypothetical protein [Gemmatimonadota bacterium]
LPVARGRVLESRAAPWPGAGGSGAAPPDVPGGGGGPGRRRSAAAEAWREAVRDACYAVRIAELRAEPVFPPEELVPSLIVTRWLEEGRPGGQAFDLDRHDADEVADRGVRAA